MGDFPHYFDIILFAMVAAFLILRLRSVLGRRTGNERRRNNPFLRQPEPTGDKVVPLGPRVATAPPHPVEPPGDGVAAGIARIRSADAEFDAAQFIDGARIAFKMIVSAFAAGDKATLRPLLSDEVYRPFCAAIDERNAAKETLETRILGLKSLDIVEADLSGRWARVTVKIVSDQINVIRAHDGSIVDGDPDHPIEKTDNWTFARDTRSSDPNWALVTTDSG
jgi:predicted lipid-binding transport protein (Tim44 family)